MLEASPAATDGPNARAIDDLRPLELPCRICGAGTKLQFTQRLLHRHDVDYHLCAGCGLLQTEPPYWLDEAYADPIADEDSDLVARNLRLARILTCLVPLIFGRDATLHDVAGGYGLLTRLLRDNGLRCWWSDKFCANLFAREFARQPGDPQATVVTAIEVLEHLEDPIAFLREALAESASRTVIFTTQLFEGTPPTPGRWTYYAPDAGQHISLYQRRTLEHLAGVLGLRLYSANGIHVLTPMRLREPLFRLATGRLSHFASPLARIALARVWPLPRILAASEHASAFPARSTVPKASR